MHPPQADIIHNRAVDRRVVFVLSSERSGSTLLRVLLGNHSRLIAPSELWLLHFESFDEWRANYPLAIDSLVELLEMVGSPTCKGQIEKQCAGWSTADVMRWVLQQVPQSAYLVDKTPAYANSRQSLERTAPFAHAYAWLIRHPLGVIDSHSRYMARRRRMEMGMAGRIWAALRTLLPHRRDTAEHSGVADRETRWREQNERIRSFLHDYADLPCARILFEELVQSPQESLNRLCQVVGVEFETEMYKPIVNRPVQDGLGDPTFGKYAAIEPRVAYAWRKRYSENLLDSATKRLLHEVVNDNLGCS